MSKNPGARNSSNLAVVITAGLLTWLVSSLILGFIVGRQNLPKYQPLAQRGKATRGVVSAKEPTNHQTIRYAYEVEGESYSGSGHAGNGNPEFDRLGVGDRVLVSYDPVSPSVSVLGDAKQLLWGEEVSVGMAAVIFPTVIVGILYAKGVLPRYRRIPDGDA